nr:M81 family metallopeptidase [Falsirhodobacter sp. alg1]
MIRIAVGGIHTECSTMNPRVQGRDDFIVAEGAEVTASFDKSLCNGIEFLPLIHARSLPGGPVASGVYAGFKADFLARLVAAMPVQGVLLLMHGAMHVQGLEDAEGDWITSVRDLVGPDIPIAVSYDLHGNVTQRIVDAIDIFAAYRTAPHEDVAGTHDRALRMLKTCLQTGTRPLVGWTPVPVLLSGECTSTRVAPASHIYAQLAPEDGAEGVLDTNMMVGYVWADTPRATAAAVVTGTDAGAMQAASNRIANAWWNARRDFSFDVTSDDLGTCLRLARQSPAHPVVLADSGDNPTGGGVGDRADVLEALIAQGMAGAVVAGIADPAATLAACAAGRGRMSCCIWATPSVRMGRRCG